MSNIKYYYKETTNQILVSGSDSKSGMNALLESIKSATPIIDANYTSKISSIGVNVSYVVDNGVEHAYLQQGSGVTYNINGFLAESAGGGTPITGLNGSLNGTNAAISVLSSQVGVGAYAISQISILNGNSTYPESDGWQIGETITISAAQLTAVGITTSTDLILTLEGSNINFTSTTIPINDNQELYVSRGFNTVGGDGDTYKYNPYLHRPYKAYILTETGSGIPSDPYVPVGVDVNTNANDSTGTIFLDKYDYAQLSIVGNVGGGFVSQSLDSGSFQIYHEDRDIDFWIFTKYHTLSNFPIAGAFYSIYQEHISQSMLSIDFSTATLAGNPGQGQVALNNATQDSATILSLNNSSAIGSLIGPYSESAANHGQTMGKIRVESNSNTSNFVVYDVTDIDNQSAYWNFGLSNGVTSTSFSPFTNAEAPERVMRANQSRTVIPNQSAAFFTRTLENGVYSYTSSAFETTAPNGTPASGSTQFGLWCNYGDYVTYRAELQSSAATDITINLHLEPD